MSTKHKAPDSAAQALLADIATRASAGGGHSIGGMRRTTISLPPRALKDLKRPALDTDRTFNTVVLAALDALLRRANRERIPGLEVGIDDLLGELGPDNNS